MVCDRLFSTKVNCLCNEEDIDLRQERLSKVKQVHKITWKFWIYRKTGKAKRFRPKKVGPEAVHKGLDQFLCA